MSYFIHTNVTDIAASEFSSAAIDDAGKLFCWGGGRYGKLGLGNEENKLEPVLVNEGDLKMGKISQVSLGTYHSLALNSEKRVFSWGYSEKGRLGFCEKFECDSLEKKLYPVEIASLREKKIIHIQASLTSSIAVSFNGDLFGWGEGLVEEVLYKPKMLELSKAIGSVGRIIMDRISAAEQISRGKISNLKVTISKIACGFMHTLALTNNGLVFVWGSGADVLD